MTSVVAHPPVMTQDQFFAWAEVQAERYEFDGFGPVAMAGGTVNHSLIAGNIFALLHGLLRGSGCTPFVADTGVQTIGHAVRYPDVVVTCSRTDGRAYTINAPVVVFEVQSPGSGRLVGAKPRTSRRKQLIGNSSLLAALDGSFFVNLRSANDIRCHRREYVEYGRLRAGHAGNQRSP